MHKDEMDQAINYHDPKARGKTISYGWESQRTFDIVWNSTLGCDDKIKKKDITTWHMKDTQPCISYHV